MKKLVVLIMVTLFMAACISADDPNRRTKQGAAVGAAAGAAAGAAIGNKSDNTRTGAVAGAVVGGVIGAAVGRRMDKQQAELEQIEGVEVQRPSEDTLNVNLRNEILFDFDSAALRSESRDTLRELAGVLARYPEQSVSVAGHTDSVGSDDYNQNLSEQRAAAVKDFLVAQGVPRSRVAAYGYGETRPVASNTSADGRQLNRRVQVFIQADPE
ncbi:MAG TPA: OmpA family protein [Thermoanaerobaculia bacterium]|nr:OmpA family protein [Thermoanaerobaculia bacterium]